jgi:MFS family permease
LSVHRPFEMCLIIATALPTIVQDLKGGQDYSWVGTSYLLASAAFTPLYGRVRYTFLCSLVTLATSLVGNLSFLDQLVSSFWGLPCAAPPRVFHS